MPKGQYDRHWKSNEELIRLFWTKVDRKSSNECWLWLRGKTGGERYGLFHVHGQKVRAHCYSFKLTHGPIPIGKQVNHICDNPLCVNPSHLYLGTQQDNMLDAHKQKPFTEGELWLINRLCKKKYKYAFVGRMFKSSPYRIKTSYLKNKEKYNG